MGEITWRNINSDMTAYQGRGLEAASRSFDSMFDKLNGVVNRTQAIDDKNWDTTKVNRTNDALRQIMGYGSPEAMAEAQKAGALQSLLQGGQIDQQAVMGAFDARMPELQRRGKQTLDYNDSIAEHNTAPLMEAARMLAIQGKPQEAQAMLDQYVAKGGRHVSQGAEYADARKQLGVTRERDDKRFGFETEDHTWKGEKFKDDLLTSAASRAYQAGQLDLSRQQLAVTRDNNKFMRDDRAEEKLYDRQAKVRAELGGLYSESANSVQAGEKFDNLLKGVKDETVQNNMRLALSEMLKDPKADTGSVLTALNTIKENEYTVTWDSTMRRNAIDLAASLRDSPSAKARGNNTDVRKADLQSLSMALDLKAAKLNGDKDEIARISAMIARGKAGAPKPRE